MSIFISDEGNAFSTAFITGTIVTKGERRQAVSKTTGKYSEFVELVVQFRQKDFPDDASCYISLRIYSQKNADLVLRLKKGSQVFGVATISSSRIDQWRRDRVKLFGNAGLLIPTGVLLDMAIESIDRKIYSESLTKYKPGGANELDFSGGENGTGRDVAF